MFARVVPFALIFAAACQAQPLAPTDVAGGELTTAITGSVQVPRRLALRPTPDPAASVPPSPEPSGPELAAIGADVFVSDALGTRVPGVPLSQANADGRYRLRGVPLGYAYVVTAIYRDATGRALTLRTLARPTAGEVDAPIGTATTLVCRHALTPARGLIGAYPGEAYQRAVTSVGQKLDPAAYPDLGDGPALDQAITGWRDADPALRADLDALRDAFTK